MTVVSQLGAPWSTLVAVMVSTVGVYVTVIVLTRLGGVRSLSKMSSFDFAATVAVGSAIASTALASTPLVNGVLALVGLFLLQGIVAALRKRDAFGGAIDNRPLLLVRDGQALQDNLDTARVSRAELWAQLRQAGVHQLAEVRAVVIETTGDLSVITGDGPLDPELLAGVRGVGSAR